MNTIIQMVVKPQKTKFQLKIVENIQTLSIWAINPWRRYSISLITVLIGYFLGSSLGMVSAVVELMDPVAALLSVAFIEILIVLRRNFRFEKKKRFLVNVPFELAKFNSYFLQILPNPLLTADQVEILKHDNIVMGSHPTLKDLDFWQ